MIQVSIVVPVFNSADCLPELVRRVNEDVGAEFDSFELILVNDASPDRSWDVISELVGEYPFVSAVNLRRNSGQNNAIMAGLHQARGEVIVIMDDDLQHDPRDIKSMYDKVGEGYDVVFADFAQKKQALWKNAGSWINDLAARAVLGKPKHIYLSPYKAICRGVVDEVVKYNGPFSYVDGILFTITSSVTQVPAQHHPRFAGKSNFNFIRSLRVWLNLTTGFSVLPLRVATVIGAISAIGAFGLAAFFIWETIMVERPPPGWASTVVILLFLGGMQLMAIGILGEYIGRIFITQCQRPQFTVREVLPSRGSEAPRKVATRL